MTIRIKRIAANAALPEYAHGPDEDAGMDLKAVEHATLLPGVPHPVATGHQRTAAPRSVTVVPWDHFE